MLAQYPWGVGAKKIIAYRENILLTDCAELEMPHQATADEVVVLAGLARISQREIGLAGIKVAHFTANTEVPHAMPEGSHIQSQATLNHASGRGAGGVSAIVEQVFILAEMAETASKAHPR
jgi:hypothetical protein